MSTKKEIQKPKKTERQLEEISQKVKASKLNMQDIIIPISVALILVMLTFFVFIPRITNAIDNRAEIAEIRGKREQLRALEEEIKTIDQDLLQQDLSNAREVIPRDLRVSAFVYYIDVLAAEKNLTSRSLSAADTQVTIRQAGERREDGRTYLGVSSPLTYSGSLDNILSFLDTLYSASPYIISIHNVSLRVSDQDSRVTLTVRGYYVSDSEIVVDLYTPFERYTKNENILEIFRQKREQLR